MIRKVGGIRVALMVMLAMQGCATVKVPTAPDAALDALYADRSAALEGQQSWSLEGRLSVSDAKDGGSGSLRWAQEADSTRMDFHGALGRGAWALQAEPGRARLERADGSVHAEDSVDKLVDGQLGWPVPVQALSWWVRGLAAPGDVQGRVLTEQGALSQLQQQGWAISFERYQQVSGIWLPGRMTATQGDRKVKLAVRKWILGDWRGDGG